MLVVHVYFMARFFWRVCVYCACYYTVIVSFILRYFPFVQLVITMTTFDSNIAKYLKIPVNFHTHSIKSSHICTSNADISCKSHPPSTDIHRLLYRFHYEMTRVFLPFYLLNKLHSNIHLSMWFYCLLSPNGIPLFFLYSNQINTFCS